MKRILVALDGSTRAPNVLAAAVRLAERCDAKLVLFRAIGLPTEVPREIYAKPRVELEDVLRSGAHADLERLAQDVPPRLVERITTTIGTPWDSIVRAARETDADLIVVGSHGFSGIDHLLGTTAAKVVNHADRNVLIVRTPL
jgi:nucleotide-binding universal stress UspA family protein